VGEQAIDLRSSLAILRRHRVVLSAAAAIGLSAGVAYVVAVPAKYSSVSLVLLPPPTHDSSGQSSSRGIDTEVRIAGSDVVLSPAGKKQVPPLTAHAMGQRVTVKAATDEVLEVKAEAARPQDAERLSAAVANSYVDYVKEAASSLNAAQLAALADRTASLTTSLDQVQAEIVKTTKRAKAELPNSAEGKADATALAQLTAQQADLALQIDQLHAETAAGRQPLNAANGAAATIIQTASPAARPSLAQRLAVFGLLGLLVVTLFMVILLLTFGRRDRKLRSRDEIADALGTPVIASVQSRMPQRLSGWTALLEGYSPGTVDAWALRQGLRQLLSHTGGLARAMDRTGTQLQHPDSITVISLAGDRKALAVGPQIASFAASVGVRTRLVTTARHDSAAALWAACYNLNPDQELRPGLYVDPRPAERDDIDLTVVLVVVDRRKPELVDIPETAVTIMAVSSGAATAQELALAAVTVDDVGNLIDGIVVADPDNLDRTTGRMLQTERVQQVSLPTRLTGTTSVESRSSRATNVRRGLR
jgi:capsular polysaccharide biosynthesis protein